MKKKLLLTFVTVLVLTAFMAAIPVCAQHEGSSSGDTSVSSSSFSDVPDTHWASDEIKWMLENNIAQGAGEGKFLPDKSVSRAEYAKMMVLTLKLRLINPETPTFQDIEKGGWQYKYVETAKWYLTVYKNSNGLYYYYPQREAQREDMAVALVKALGLDKETPDLTVLDAYTDSGDISEKLKSYMAIAVKNGLIAGYTDSSGNKVLAPKETITRAQAAVLLYNAFKQNEEKITFEDEEEKGTYEGSLDTEPVDEEIDEDTDEDGDYDVPVVKAVVRDGGVMVTWNKISDSRLQGYKVVVSKYNTKPKYPDDGYIEWITDRDRIYRFIESGNSYNGGDFGGTVKSGVTYYFSVTAVYDDRKVAGNVVQLKMP